MGAGKGKGLRLERIFYEKPNVRSVIWSEKRHAANKTGRKAFVPSNSTFILGLSSYHLKGRGGKRGRVRGGRRSLPHLIITKTRKTRHDPKTRKEAKKQLKEGHSVPWWFAVLKVWHELPRPHCFAKLFGAITSEGGRGVKQTWKGKEGGRFDIGDFPS